MIEPADAPSPQNSLRDAALSAEDKSVLYRRKSSECLAHAERVTGAENKAQWLQLAESWQKLADRTESATGTAAAENGS